MTKYADVEEVLPSISTELRIVNFDTDKITVEPTDGISEEKSNWGFLLILIGLLIAIYYFGLN